LQKLAKIREEIKNQRNDVSQKLSAKVIREFDLIVVENLQKIF